MVDVQDGNKSNQAEPKASGSLQVMGPANAAVTFPRPRLNGKNWSKFAFSFRASLRGLRLTKFIDEETATGEEADICYSLIVGAVEPEQIDILLETTIPQQAWTALR